MHSHIQSRLFLCLMHTVTYVHPLQVAVLLSTPLYTLDRVQQHDISTSNLGCPEAGTKVMVMQMVRSTQTPLDHLSRGHIQFNPARNQNCAIDVRHE